MKVIGYNGFSDEHFKALIVELNPMEVKAVSALLPGEAFNLGYIKAGTEHDLGQALADAVDNSALVLFLLELALIVWAASYFRRQKAKKRQHDQRHQLSRWWGNDASLALYEARREVGGHGVRVRG